MDCDTVRLFLHFVRPTGTDLDGPEAEELHAHLEQCNACNALAMNARRVDQHLGRAMNAVEVPAGLKSRITARLADERGAVHRRWLRRASYVAAVAASLLLLVWGTHAWLTASDQNKIYVDKVVYSAGPAPDLPAGAPDFVNYSFLTGVLTKAQLPGHPQKVVPQLVFMEALPPAAKAPKTQPDRPKARQAIVYILPGTKDKIVPPDEDISGYEYKLAVKRSDDERYTYLILYNGDSWDWLRAKRDE
jgi:hypothetical protein